MLPTSQLFMRSEYFVSNPIGIENDFDIYCGTIETKLITIMKLQLSQMHILSLLS